MIITEEISFEMNDTEIIRLFTKSREECLDLRVSLLTRELLPSFHFVRAHRNELFESIPTVATVSIHHQDGDDPPDVVFKACDKTVAIEVTSSDPKHFHQNEEIRENFRKQGMITHDLPRSIATKSRQESERKLTGQDLDTWESVPDHLNSCIHDVLREVERKIKKKSIQNLAGSYSIFVVLITGRFFDEKIWKEILKESKSALNCGINHGVRVAILSGSFTPSAIIVGDSSILI